MNLEQTQEGFTANFYTGIYNQAGTWDDVEVPEKEIKEVTRTQVEFASKLGKMLADRFALQFELHPDSEQFS
jgi:sigma factor-binding protein Crl